MFKGGRRQDPVWESFEKIVSNGKISAKCKNCGHIQSNKAERMKSHVLKCVRNTTSEECVDMPPKLTDMTEKSVNNSEIMLESYDPPPKKKIQLDSNITRFISQTTVQDKVKFDLLVAKLFYACNIPFAVADSEAFKNLIHALKPSYKPPSRKQLAGELLDTVYNSVDLSVKESLSGKEGTLIVDGWSDIHNAPITASCIQVNGASFIVDVEETGAAKKTSEFLTKKCSEIISNVETKYNCDIKSIVTDNAKNMEKMRNALEKVDDENSVFITYGCGAHWMNLLGEDITPTNVLKYVVEIHKYFRNHHAPGSWLKECEGHVSPQLPGITRWNSQLTCLESFERNHTIYLKIVNEHYEEMDVNIVNRIRDFNLHRQVKDLIKQLKPISVALNVMQKNSTTIADACHVWHTLLKNEELKPHFSKLKKRFEQAVLPCHLVAYLLHPKYRGELLNYDQKESCKAWLCKINPDFIFYVINFELKEKPFPNSYFAEEVITSVSAYNWWRSIEKACEISKDFCSLVAHLQTCPASSAAIERFFSNFSFVQTKIRNKLSTNTLSKLVYCYAMLKQQKLGCDGDITELFEFE